MITSKLRSAVDAKLQFGDVLIVVNGVVVGVESSNRSNAVDDPVPQRAPTRTPYGGQKKTAALRQQIMEVLESGGPMQSGTICDRILGPDSGNHPKRPAIRQTIERMRVQKFLLIPAQDKGKMRPRYMARPAKSAPSRASLNGAG